MDRVLLIIAFVLIVAWFFVTHRPEGFGLGPLVSSAFGWNVSTQYEQGGPATGYGLYGVWPGNVPGVPWKYWMWRRRPTEFTSDFVLSPQIVYNHAPPMSLPVSNYSIGLIADSTGKVTFSVNGQAVPTLELDRGVQYYLHVNTPGLPFVITADQTQITTPLETGSIAVMFGPDDPDVLHYTSPKDPNVGGIIYLNNLKPVGTQ